MKKTQDIDLLKDVCWDEEGMREDFMLMAAHSFAKIWDNESDDIFNDYYSDEKNIHKKR